MRKPEIISHKGAEIIYLNFTNMRNIDEIIELESAGGKLIQEQAFGSAFTLTNMDGMFFNNEIRNHFSTVVKANTPFVKASAVIGLTGLISIMYSSFVKLSGRNIKLFKTKDDAMEYLASCQ